MNTNQASDSPKYSKSDFEHITGEWEAPDGTSGTLDLYVCVNCGGQGETTETVKHFDSCKPGESKKWEQYYNDAEMCVCHEPDYDPITSVCRKCGMY